MRDIYHCTPSQLDDEDDAIVEAHREFIRMDAKQRRIAERRAAQRGKIGATID